MKCDEKVNDYVLEVACICSTNLRTNRMQYFIAQRKLTTTKITDFTVSFIPEVENICP